MQSTHKPTKNLHKNIKYVTFTRISKRTTVIKHEESAWESEALKATNQQPTAIESSRRITENTQRKAKNEDEEKKQKQQAKLSERKNEEHWNTTSNAKKKIDTNAHKKSASAWACAQPTEYGFFWKIAAAYI